MPITEWLKANIEGFQWMPYMYRFFQDGTWIVQGRGYGRTYCTLMKVLYNALLLPRIHLVYLGEAEGWSENAFRAMQNVQMKDGSQAQWHFSKAALNLQLPNGSVISFRNRGGCNELNGLPSSHFYAD